MTRHDRTILRYLARNPGCIRKQVLDELRLRRNTVTESCARLIRQGKIVEVNRGKRRNVKLKINPDAFLALGIEHTDKGVLQVVLDSDKIIRSRRFVPLPRTLTGELRCRSIADAIAEELARLPSPLKALGIGFCDIGRVNEQAGRSILAVALKGWEDIPIREILSKRCSLPVDLFHSSPPYCEAERLFGCASGWDEFLFLWADARIGLGIRTMRGLLHATSGVEGELGHVVVEEPGRACRCGNRGCLETVAAAEAVRRHAAADSADIPSLTDVIAAARLGQKPALLALDDSARAIGRVLAGIINVVGIPRLVLKGSLPDAGAVFLDPLRDVLTRQCVYPLNANLSLTVSTTDAYAGAAGAAWLVLERAFAGTENGQG
jgi:predicted NBD/HSP70 family sugar kinase